MIKKHIIRYRSRRALKKNPVKRENPSFHSARHIGIIFTWEGEKKTEIIQKFLQELDLTGKNFETLCFLPSSARQVQVPEAFRFFTKNDFNALGTIRSEFVQGFIDKKFDFLFHLDTLSNIYIENIMARCQAKCRVSSYDLSRKDYYDFMIKAGENQAIDQLCREILHYTKSLVAYG